MRLRVPNELIIEAKGGERADLERLLEALWPDAYRLAMAIVIDSQCAEDTAQEACVTIYRNIGSLRNAEAFHAWFYRIVVREALKQKKNRVAMSALLTDVTYCEDCSASVDLWQALATLPKALRTVIVLHYFEGLSSREIGGILHIPHATVRFRLMTAKRRLQPLLKVYESSAQSKGAELYVL